MWSETRQTSFFACFRCFCILKWLSFAGTLATPTAARVPLTPTSRWTPRSRKCHQSLFKFSWSSRNVKFAVGREVTAALSYSSVGGCSFLAPLTMCRCLAVPSPPPRSTERHCMTWGSTRRVRNLISSLHTPAGLNADWITMHRKVFTQIVFTSSSFALKLSFAEELATFSTCIWLYLLLHNSLLIAVVFGYKRRKCAT